MLAPKASFGLHPDDAASDPDDDARLETAISFFEAIFAPDDLVLFRRVESWTEDGKKRTRIIHNGTAHVPASREALTRELGRQLTESRLAGANCYFGVCPRFGAEGQFDLAFQIRIVRVLWADLDHCTAEEARSRIAAADLPSPSIIVNSGSGVHLYWLLDEPFLIDDAGAPPAVQTEWRDAPDGRRTSHKFVVIDGEKLELEQHRHLKRLSPKALHVQNVLAGIAQAIGGDHTTDLSRMLRVPGSLNRKNARNGEPPKETRLVEFDASRRYSLCAFERIAKSSQDAERDARIDKMPLPRESRLRGKKLDHFERLIAACQIAKKGDRSGADFACCCYAISQGVSRSEAWSRVKDIGKFAEGGTRYFDLTWSNAEYHVRSQILDGLEAPRALSAPPPIDLEEEEAPGPNIDASPSLGNSQTRTTIVMNDGTPVYVTMSKITERLLAAGNFYRRADQLVSVKNGNVTAILDSPQLIGQVNALAEFYYIENKVGKYRPLSTALANTWLHHPFEISKLPPLNLFSHNPVYTSDWRLLAPGYDPESGIFYAGPKVEPKQGRRYLDRLLRDFCFKSPCDRTNYIGMLLTALLVPHFIGSKPALLLNGNQPGLGKSVLAQLVAILRDGQQVETATFNSNDEEFEKRLGSIVHRGATTVVIDNAKSTRGRKLDSPSLERSITDPILAYRYLGKSASIQTENSHIFCITANAPEVSPDLVSRSVIVNLEHEGDPRHRRFSISNPEEFAQVHRQELLAELCGMIELWKSARMKLADVETRFNKRNWGNIIGGILEVNGEPDFLDNADEAAAQIDETRRDFTELVAEMASSDAGNWRAIDLVAKCQTLRLLLDDIGEGSEKSKQTRFGKIAGRYIDERFDTPAGRAIFRRDTDRNGSLYRVALVD